jgi:hypothetical protein
VRTQALGQDAIQRGDEIVRLDAHVQEAAELDNSKELPLG